MSESYTTIIRGHFELDCNISYERNKFTPASHLTEKNVLTT